MFIAIHKSSIEEFFNKQDNTISSCIIGKSKGQIHRGIIQRGMSYEDCVVIYVDDSNIFNKQLLDGVFVE